MTGLGVPDPQWLAATAVVVAALVTAGAAMWARRQADEAADEDRELSREEKFRDQLLARLAQVEAAEARLLQRVEALERRERESRAWRRSAVGYIRSLIDILHTHDIPVPPPPAGLDFD